MPKKINPHAAIFSLAIVLALATASECHSITHLPSLQYGALLWVWWAFIASALWKMGRQINMVSTFSLPMILAQVFIGVTLGVAHLLLLGALESTQWRSLLDINRLGIELLIYGFVFAVIAVIQFQIPAQREAMQSLSLQKELSAAHLRALQMQLEPHFLFNTLNAITTLVELGRQKAAAEMLSHLNAILEEHVDHDDSGKVPLSQELELVGNYLAIEQVRFADRLRVEINVDPGAVDGLVPCFLLQPIVENAIRHGIANYENNGLVEASATRDGDLLHVLVRDTGSGRFSAKHNGHGIGLGNTRERLAHFYQDGYEMQAHSLDAGGFEVAITIPYECGAL